jgi:hypothetical protein
LFSRYVVHPLELDPGVEVGLGAAGSLVGSAALVVLVVGTSRRVVDRLLCDARFDTDNDQHRLPRVGVRSGALAAAAFLARYSGRSTVTFGGDDVAERWNEAPVSAKRRLARMLLVRGPQRAPLDRGASPDHRVPLPS